MSKPNPQNNTNDHMNLGRMISILRRFMGGQTHLFLLSGLMLVFEAATAVLVPLLMAFIIDYLTARLTQISSGAIPPPLSPLGKLGLPPVINPDVDTVAIITIGIVLLAMINSLADSMAEIYLAKGGRQLGFNLRVSLYAHLQKLSLAFHDQRHTGDILTRVTSDVAALEDFIISSLSDFVGSVLLIIFILIAMIINAWQVALVAAVIIPIMALISRYFTGRIKAASKKRRASEGELASAAQEMLASIRVIQTYGLGSYEQAMFSAQSHKAMDAALEAASYQARFSWVVSVLGAVSTAAVIWMAVFLIFRAPITAAGIGLLTAYIKYIQDMFKPTKRIIQEWNTLSKLYASVERIGDLMDTRPSVQDEWGAVDAPVFKGQIEFRDVHFAYPVISKTTGAESKQRSILNGINFIIHPGQVIAVVGHTGAGKSTIAQLIPRLYDPTSGAVLIDGRDLREFTLDSLRAQISMVLQESILFSGSVVENIAYGRPEATVVEIMTASKQANAHEFIEKLPEGYYTMLGERGSNLSGGQCQRLAIARAFVRNTPILILDEPTTGLDAESTELVLRALHRLMKGKTTIIISHDLNLIRDADKIIVIKDGRIEQIGRHEELLRAGGLYASLYAKQYGERAVEASGDGASRDARLRGAGGASKDAGQATALIAGATALSGIPGPAGNPGSSVIQRTAADLSKEYPLKDLTQPLKNLGVKSMTETMDFDLTRSAAYANWLPGLTTAFSASEIKPALQKALFDPARTGGTILACKPGKGLFLPGLIVNMQYELEIQNSNGEITHSLVNARLFSNLVEAKDFYRKNLAPLARRMNGREEVRLFGQPVALVEPLNMTLSVFPIDGMLPTLIDATDPVHMIPVFEATLPEAMSGAFAIRDMRLDLAHYGRFQRCVLRYLLQGEQNGLPSPHTMQVYGKVDGEGLGRETVTVIGTLAERLQDPSLPYQFNIPRAYGYLPDQKLLLMQALPGKPVVKQLIQSLLATGSSSPELGLSLEEAMELCARIAATLHSSGIKLGRRRSLEIDSARLENEIRVVQEVSPQLGEKLHTALAQTLDFAQLNPAMPLCFSHGDYTYTQLIFDGNKAGLVDFDTVCQAEPALDLGQFLAYQRLTFYKERNPEAPLDSTQVDRLCEGFVNSYISISRGWLADEALLRARTSVYELISLIRLTLHSWQKLKGSRLKLALQLLEERMECLIRVS